MEVPFIVKKMLQDNLNFLKYEIDRGDVYTVEQRDFMSDIRSKMRDWLNAEKNAEIAEKYPEHAKFDPHRDAAQAIGNWIDNGGYTICTWPEGQSHPVPVHKSINDILAEHFDIDMVKLENEKRQMLEELAAPRA